MFKKKSEGKKKVKYVFITGGVCSSLGKGITAGAIGLLLERQKQKIAIMKLDPYLNVDPGTMSPFQHGEVYVTDDGAETDLDLGHYFRFTHSPLSKLSSTSSGQIYESVIKRERKGDYLGKTVQVIPHVTDEIKKRIYDCAFQEEGIDIVVAEIGGTVGDIESQPFLEAIRQFRYENKEDCVNIHLTYVPYIAAAGEMKTKPTQHSVQIMREIGLSPDLILCRTELELPEELKDKISLFCNVSKECVIEEIDVDESIYEVPLQLKSQGVDKTLCTLLDIPYSPASLSDWEKVLDKKQKITHEVVIGIVGKYVEHKDAYKSLYEALDHAATSLGCRLSLRLFEADKIVKDGKLVPEVAGCDGYLIPGGFGERGWQGKILAAKHSREERVPYFGICLGMQVLAVEFARNVCGLSEANSYEIDPDTSHPIVNLLEDQVDVKNIGGTMRLGAFSCDLAPNSLAKKAYKKDKVSERHRHRLEFNSNYKERLEAKGLKITGTMTDSTLCEIAEIENHPWMLGCQFHPEFISSPVTPHPLFIAFVEATIKYRQKESLKEVHAK